MARGIDHIVHAVRDLDGAAELYRRLGFTVGARNRHPWGTHNYIVQFGGCFIELLTVAEPALVPEHTPKHFSFGAFNHDFLKQREGLSMLVLEGRGAADVEAFDKAGIGLGEPFYFEREGRRPDGQPIKVAFTLAFARDHAAPNVGFFTCQQHYPENFWNPAFQAHANGAVGIRGAVLVAADAPLHRDFVAAWTGVAALYQRDDEISARTPRGTFSVMTPARFAEAFGAPPPRTDEPYLAALRVAVADVGRASDVVTANGVASHRHRDGFVIDCDSGLSATISFEPAEKSGS